MHTECTLANQCLEAEHQVKFEETQTSMTRWTRDYTERKEEKCRARRTAVIGTGGQEVVDDCGLDMWNVKLYKIQEAQGKQKTTMMKTR